MRAISLRQPWAQLIAHGAKRYETRSWMTRQRGPLAIHASLEFSTAARAMCRREPFSSALCGEDDLPLGCVVALCDLAAVFPTSPADASLFPVEDWTERERTFGDFTPGRWAWQLDNIRALEVPIPVRGSLGLWHWDEAALGLHPENRHLMKKPTTQYRQGDVLIERIAKLPANLAPHAPENGRIILAHGEVTGHAHAFAPGEADKLIGPAGAEFFEIRGTPIEIELPLLRAWKDQVMVRHPKLGVLEFAAADVEVRGKAVRIAGDFGLLQHDEHATQAIPAGFYRGAGAGGTVRQREYSPEEIRNVAD